MPSPVGRIVTITSGKGGVGKTSVAVNLGLALTQRGFRVCVVDADTNLANINIMLKQVPEYTLEHVINGEKSIHEILLKKNDLYVVPAASGVVSLVGQVRKQSQCLVDAVKSLKSEFDYVLVDTAAGISDSVISYIKGSDQSVFVITAEPTSLTDSYSLLKVLFKSRVIRKTDIIVNYSQNEKHANNVFSRFSTAVEKYMNVNIGCLGFVYRDDYLSSSVCFQNPLILQRPKSATSQCFRDIADNLQMGLEDGAEEPNPVVEPVSINAGESFSCDDSAEKTVSLVNLENDINQYLDTNRGSQDEIELTLKKLADKYQQVFESKPVEIPEKVAIKREEKEAIRQLEKKARLARNACYIPVIEDSDNETDYQGYLESIHLASLVGEYTDTGDGELC